VHVIIKHIGFSFSLSKKHIRNQFRLHVHNFLLQIIVSSSNNECLWVTVYRYLTLVGSWEHSDQQEGLKHFMLLAGMTP